MHLTTKSGLICSILGWACTKPELSFPTLDCIKADIMSCGVLGRGRPYFIRWEPGLFKPGKVYVTNLLPKASCSTMHWDFSGGNLSTPGLTSVLNNQNVKLTSGTYSQLPWPSSHSERSSLRLRVGSARPNSSAILGYSKTRNYQRTTEWRQGDGPERFQLPDIDPNNPPPVTMRRRDTEACPFPPFSSDAPTPTPSPDTTSSTPAPTTSSESTTETWTSNCNACTLVGGIADSPTCTSISGCTPTAAPTPTIAAWVGNLSTIDIGDAEDGNGGKDLAMEMFTKLKGMCSPSGCKSNHAEMDNVETVLANGEQPLKPAMYLQDAQYSSQEVLEKMLSVGIGARISVLNNEDLQRGRVPARRTQTRRDQAAAMALFHQVESAEKFAVTQANCSGREAALLKSADLLSAAGMQG
ncbi:hypothetical protein CHU98_g9518 [Xylaria longipes]|nr:hypothetical protein CHU98_g9518 [Xylaria longipes]